MLHLLLGLLMALSVADGTINVTTGAIGTTFTVSGLSFQPKALIFFWSGRSSNGFGEEDSRFGMGYAVSTSSRRVYGGVSRHANASSSAFGMRRSDCCITTVSTGAVVNGRADLNAINSDGFELIIDQAFAAALQVGWLALGGDDLTDAEIVDIQMPGASGDQDVATSFALNTGEDDKALLFLGASANNANNPESSCRLSVGAAAGDTIVNALTSGMSRSGRPTMMTISYARTGDCVAVANTGADDALAARAAVTSWLSTGFRLNWTITSAVTAHISALVLKGGRFEVGDALTSTGTSNQNEGTAYEPKALLVASHGKAASSAGTTQAGDERSVGAATGASSRRTASQHDRDGIADSDIAIGYHEDRIYNNIDTAATAAIEGAADLVSFNATPSFTYVMDDADPVAAFFWYLSFADVPDAGGGDIELVVQDALHAHAADSPTLTQANTLAVADALHAHAAESPTLVQQNTLAVQEASHGHTADSPSLTQQSTITVADALHGHTADNPTLGSGTELVVADALHGHTAESPPLTQANMLAAQDATHAHTAESPVLNQANILSVDDALHAHFADNIVVSIATVGLIALRSVRVLGSTSDVAAGGSTVTVRQINPRNRVRELT